MSSNELVKIVCGRCGDYFYVSSVREYARQIDAMWRPWEKSMTPEQKERVREMNDPTRLEKIWKTEGAICALCDKCRVDLTLEALAKQQRDELK